MTRKKSNSHPGLYGEVAVRAMADALYQRLIDRRWEQVQEVFARPEIREAEDRILAALAESFRPKKSNGLQTPRRKAKR